MIDARELAAMFFAACVGACEADTAELSPLAIEDVADAGVADRSSRLQAAERLDGSAPDAERCVYRDDDADLLPHPCP